MRKIHRAIASTVVGLTLLAHAGCAKSQPSRFYLLSALVPSGSASEGSGRSIGVGPIDFPDYLNRPQIVTRGNGNRIYLGEFDRWAEPLAENFVRVLAQDLAALLAPDNVVPYPWRRSARIDHQIIVRVSRFDAMLDGGAVLHVHWTVRDADGRTIVPPRTSRITESGSSTDYEAIVQAGSRALEQLSHEIAAAIGQIDTRPTPDEGDG